MQTKTYATGLAGRAAAADVPSAPIAVFASVNGHAQAQILVVERRDHAKRDPRR